MTREIEAALSVNMSACRPPPPSHPYSPHTFKRRHRRDHQIGVNRFLEPGLVHTQHYVGPREGEGQGGEVGSVGQARVQGVGREPIATAKGGGEEGRGSGGE